MNSNYVVQVQADDFDIAAEYQWLRENNNHSGAFVHFIGQVRDLNLGEAVQNLHLEHYPGMTEKVLEKIMAEAQSRWQLDCIKIIHRYGDLSISDQIVFIGIGSKHRDHAFDACRFIIDLLKTQAPFWKKETTPQGANWLDAQNSDQNQAQTWLGSDD